MALLWVDGFDYATSTADVATRYPSPGGLGAFSANGTGRRSGKALNIVNSGVGLTKALTTSSSTVICGYAMQQSNMNASAGGDVGAFQVGDTAPHVSIGLNSNGSITAYRGNVGGTTLGTSALSVWTSSAGFFYIEVKVLISATVGTVDVHINGVSVLSLTGQNTKGGSTTSFTYIALGGAFGVFNQQVDDLYVCDGSGAQNNTFLGDCRVDVQMPTAPGSNNGSTPSTGTDRSATIKEIPPDGDTTYNAISSTGVLDTVDHAAMVNTGHTLFGVAISIYSKKSAAGVCSAEPMILLGGTLYAGTTTQPQNTTYGYFSQIYDTDPSGSAWTESNFNSMEVGYERTL